MWLERMGVKLTWGMVISMFTSYADLFGVLMLFMVIDFITGYAKGYVTKTLNSTRSGIGIVKKFIIMCLVVMAHYLRIISGYEGIELLVLYFFIANECLSILENSVHMGINIPTKLYQALEQLQGGDELNIGDQINDLTVMKILNNGKVKCKCKCGNISYPFKRDLLRQDNRQVKSCGCRLTKVLQDRNTTHNLSKSRLYHEYYQIQYRCYNSNCKSYKHYGGRGITMCDEWKDDFQAFYDWAIQNGYSDNLTIDRIDVNGNYEPSNCRWVDWKEQQNNRRNNHYVIYNGEKLTVQQCCNKYNLDYKLILARLNRGWDIDTAIDEPKNRSRGIMINYLGKDYTINKLTKKLQIPYNTFRYHYDREGQTYIKSLEQLKGE